MAAPAYTVASDSETTGEEKSSSAFPEIAIGVDIRTSQCSVAIWNGSQVELLKNTRNQKLMRSYVTFKDEIPSSGVRNQLSHEHEVLSGASIFNMKRLIGRVDTDPVVHASKNLPFLVQTLDIGVRPLIAALVNNVWRSTAPEEVLAIFLVELRVMAEIQLKSKNHQELRKIFRSWPKQLPRTSPPTATSYHTQIRQHVAVIINFSLGLLHVGYETRSSHYELSNFSYFW